LKWFLLSFHQSSSQRKIQMVLLLSNDLLHLLLPTFLFIFSILLQTLECFSNYLQISLNHSHHLNLNTSFHLLKMMNHLKQMLFKGNTLTLRKSVSNVNLYCICINIQLIALQVNQHPGLMLETDLISF